MEFNNKMRIEQTNRYKQILNLFKENKYDRVIKEATKYLELTPNNVQVRFMRAKSYRALEQFEEAITDLLYNKKIDNNYHSITELYYIYYYLNMYDKALELLPTMYSINTMNRYSLALSEFVMKTSMGIDMKFMEYRDEYIKNQIRNYDKEKTIIHISEHIKENKDKTIFNENINLEYLLDIVKNNINSSKKANINEILEVHYFLIHNIGHNQNGNSCNYIKVVVIPNTNKIISMYPVDKSKGNNDNILECDYDKLFNKNEQVKVKTISRIDKFNQRYKR